MLSKLLLKRILWRINKNEIKNYLHGRPDFTKNRYKVSRGHYNYLNDEHVTYFENLLGRNRVVMDLSDLEKYNVDWYNQVRGCSTIVLKPKTTEEVSEILHFCNEKNLAVCPQGGNTSVNGGSVPVFDEIIVSAELMNKIISIDETSGVLVCQSGCILEDLDRALEKKGLIVPLDIGSKGTCQIGGNVSTNAGGMRLLRFGSMHRNVLGLQVVKANGEILDCLSTLRKNNTGYHMKHFFIGSEGSLGFITDVALQCCPRPKSRNVALLGIQSFNYVLEVFRESRQHLGEILSAFEVMDASTMDFIKENTNHTTPIGEHPFYVIIETLGSKETHDSMKMENLLERFLDKDLITNGTLASDKRKIDMIWSIREDISNGYKSCGAVLFYDVTVPLEQYYTLVDYIRNVIANDCERVFGYGHMGDGNLHLQIQLKEYCEEIKNRLDELIFQKVVEMNGSISAEHGLGFIKAKYLDLAKPKSTIHIMCQLKKLFDPKGILNPYKVFSEIKL